MVQKLWFRSWISSTVVDIPFRSAVADLMVQTFQQTTEILPLLVDFRWSMSLLCGSCRFSGAAEDKDLGAPQLQLDEKSDSFYGPLYLAVTCLVFAFGVQVYGLFWEILLDVSRIQRYLVRSVYGGFWNYFTRFRPSYFSAMLGSTADSCSCVRLRRLLRFTLKKTSGNSAVAVFYGRRHFLHGAESDFHGLAVQQTMVSPRLQFLNAVIDVPVVQVVQVHFPSRRRGCFLWSRRFVGPYAFPSC